jgi:hypothetical protein
MPNHEYFSHYGIECATHSTHSAYLYDGEYPGACLARHYRDEDRVESNLERMWGQLWIR